MAFVSTGLTLELYNQHITKRNPSSYASRTRICVEFHQNTNTQHGTI